MERSLSFSHFRWWPHRWVWTSMDIFGDRIRYSRHDWYNLSKAEMDGVHRYFLGWGRIGLDNSERHILFMTGGL